MVKIRSPRSSSVLRALFTAAALRPDHARFLHFVSGGSAGGGGPSASASSTSAGTAAGAGGAAYPLKGPLEITTPTTSTTTPAKLNVTECTADLFGSERAKIYCGNCRAVSKWAYSATVAHTCNDFCHSFGLHCTDAYDDLANSCAADGRSRGCAYEFRFTDDAICQCATWKQLEEREKEKTHPSADHLHNGAEQHGGLEPVLLRGSWVYREFFDANCRVPTTVEARGRIDDTCFPETMKSSKKLTTCGLTHAWYTYYPDTVDCGGKNAATASRHTGKEDLGCRRAAYNRFYSVTCYPEEENGVTANRGEVGGGASTSSSGVNTGGGGASSSSTSPTLDFASSTSTSCSAACCEQTKKMEQEALESKQVPGHDVSSAVRTSGLARTPSIMVVFLILAHLIGAVAFSFLPSKSVL
ncbi:unnamed protein product [Amoebophrya sp. A120]|nr:unnamed protein product [Amoebophrya sp. A120]|eukprot:GSA120T00006728001.1